MGMALNAPSMLAAGAEWSICDHRSSDPGRYATVAADHEHCVVGSPLATLPSLLTRDVQRVAPVMSSAPLLALLVPTTIKSPPTATPPERLPLPAGT